MKKLLAIVCALLSLTVHASESSVEPRLNTELYTEPVTVSSTMTVVEEKVRKAAVKVISLRGTHGSGSLVKYKGLTLMLTAQHVTDDDVGFIYNAVANGEIKKAMLIYADPVHDISVLYMLEEFDSVVPLKFSPAEKLTEIGEEITYSGFPSSHQLMTFRGRVAGYEILRDEGIQILLHTHGWFGCSGSVVYDSEGDIVGVLWGLDVETRPRLQVIDNLIWIQPIQVLNIDHALEALCASGEIKARACR
jgi:hypothetical protein